MSEWLKLVVEVTIPISKKEQEQEKGTVAMCTLDTVLSPSSPSQGKVGGQGSHVARGSGMPSNRQVAPKLHHRSVAPPQGRPSVEAGFCPSPSGRGTGVTLKEAPQ